MANMNDIKTLRTKTGAGFADCKKALEEANNDIDAAIKILKEMGMAAAEKRSGRATGEGSIFTTIKGNKAALLELQCETDFVARNTEFQTLGKELAEYVLDHDLVEKNDEMLAKVQELIGTIKENMEISKIQVVEKEDDEIFATYTHGTPARLGAIVVVKSTSKDSKVEAFAFNCALHAVAKLPLFLDQGTVDSGYKKEQMEIIDKQVADMGKPAVVAEKISEGKWKKHLTEVCFVLQPWVHDEQSTAEKELESLSKELGETVRISNFIAHTLGNE